jgi:hypothetical protein
MTLSTCSISAKMIFVKRHKKSIENWKESQECSSFVSQSIIKAVENESTETKQKKRRSWNCL